LSQRAMRAVERQHLYGFPPSIEAIDSTGLYGGNAISFAMR
jgi:hypothetical protein